MEQRHRHRDRGHGGAGPAGEAVDHALLGLDIGLGLPQLRFGHRGLGTRGLGRSLGHFPLYILVRVVAPSL